LIRPGVGDEEFSGAEMVEEEALLVVMVKKEKELTFSL
jgi:hypothetical protein